jgi:uncharacterized membrane protein YraQ (UPF0718 family)
MNIFYPIQFFANTINDLIGLTKESYFGSAVNFFVYDTIKIGLLLIVINYIMAITRYYFPMEKARDILTKKRWFGVNYLMAAVLGVVTPFCSCSSIPLFVGFMGAGIPLGITFAFLIASPLINESSLYFFPAMFGLKVTILYNFFGLAIAVLGGMLIQRLRLEKYVIPELLKFKSRAQIETENGGQNGDIGAIEFEGKNAVVLETSKFHNLNLSKVDVKDTKLNKNQNIEAVVINRHEVAKHHSATHLLQAALKMVLGDSVSQAGSFNDANKLRFDFTYPEAYMMILLIDERPEEVTDMERSVNAEVIASTFDESAEKHVKVANLVLAK